MISIEFAQVCSSMDGSPQPRLSWFKGDEHKEISSSNLTTTPFAMSSLQMMVTREDSDREYRLMQFFELS